MESESFEIEEEYKEVIDNIIKKIFGDKIILTEEDYRLFDKVRNHKSMTENNYEILETLGDGILKHIIIQSIIESCKEELSESYISELRMLLERTEIFSYLLTQYFGEIEDYINYVQTSNPYEYESIKEDIFEALIGCLYQIIYDYTKNNNPKDNLIIILFDYYKQIFIDYIKILQDNNNQLIVNYVKQLSEYCMKNHKTQPTYKYKKLNTYNGVIYEMSVMYDGHIEKCQERTVKKAKQQCAYLMLYHLHVITNKKIDQYDNIKNIYWEE